MSLPRAPSLSEWLLLGFLVLLCITNPMALFRRDSVIELDAGGLVLPERYEQIVPWEAVMGVRLNGKDVLIDIAAGERFGRRRKGFYRLFPEQARYKGNDLQIIDANRTTVRANDLVRCIEHYMPDAVRSPA